MSVSDIQVRNTAGNLVSVFPLTLAQIGANDRIVAQGLSGRWYYIKYESGIGAYFQTVQRNVYASVAWNNIYYDSRNSFSAVAVPFPLWSISDVNMGPNTPPSYFAIVQEENGYYWTAVREDNNTNPGITSAANLRFPGVYFLSAAQQTSSSPKTVDVLLGCIGRWQ